MSRVVICYIMVKRLQDLWKRNFEEVDHKVIHIIFMQNSAHFLSPLGRKQAGFCGDTVLIPRIAVWPFAQITAVL